MSDTPKEQETKPREGGVGYHPTEQSPANPAEAEAVNDQQEYTSGHQ